MMMMTITIQINVNNELQITNFTNYKLYRLQIVDGNHNNSNQ